jgi:hypothetical protein
MLKPGDKGPDFTLLDQNGEPFSLSKSLKEEAQAVGVAVKQAIGGPFAIAHATLELERERCVDDDENDCGVASSAGTDTNLHLGHHQ